jgi:hypothetical protein
MRSLLSVASLVGVGLMAAVGCGSSSDTGSSSAAGVVSCDIQQSGLHYCEEARGSSATSSGCPAMMAGFVPGTGCSRTGLSGTCSANGYDFFLYTSGASASALAGICPGGTFQPVNGDGGVNVGTGGSTSSTTAGSCVALQACCNSSTNATLKASCLQVYTSAMASGDQGCATYLPLYKLALSCP